MVLRLILASITRSVPTMGSKRVNSISSKSGLFTGVLAMAYYRKSSLFHFQGGPRLIVTSLSCLLRLVIINTETCILTHIII